MTELSPAPLILTLALDPESQAHFNALRRAHFPPKRNYLDAHVTLFHHLPGSEEAAITARLREVTATYVPFSLRVSEVWMMGRGVAYRLASDEAQRLRAELATGWSAWLTPQDAQGWRPHITVQNRVSPADAQALQAILSRDFTPFPITATGLTLWRYLGGPWEKVGSFILSS
jgi:2'-5' RNA ligase